MATPTNHSNNSEQEAHKNPAPRTNDGSNDNPDEFSEFRKPGSSSTEDYSRESRQADPAQQPGHVEQNQNPEAVQAAENAPYTEQREAWAEDDPRYGSGPRPETPDPS
ncbi:hypothetical protein [Hymenobacter koreensis]|uniref:Uncharacterized protein n=1 Tax=Hymenobacter koreensis TaxID=1084523 RepID=A0ABP8J3N3_9BACT